MAAHPHTSSKSPDPRVAAFTITPSSTLSNSDLVIAWDGNDWKPITYADLAAQIGGGGGAGTVTSVDVSGGTTGLTTSGGPVVTSGTITLAGTLIVDNGGTGRTTGTTAYGLIAAGTTATGAQQTLAAGTTAQLLVGGGAAALPVWTTATGTGAPVRADSPTITTLLNVGTAFVIQDTGSSNGRIVGNAIFSFDCDAFFGRSANTTNVYLSWIKSANTVSLGFNGSTAVTINGIIDTAVWQGATVNYAYLGSGGTGAGTKVLYDDNTWQTPSSPPGPPGPPGPPPAGTNVAVLSSTDLNAAVTGFTSLLTASAQTVVTQIVVRVTSIASFTVGPSISVGTNSATYNDVMGTTAISLSADDTLVVLGPSNGAIVIPNTVVLFCNVSTAAATGTYTITVEVLGYTV